MRGRVLMWRGKVAMGILLVMLLITLTNGKEEEEEGQKLPRPSVVRGEILKTPKSTSSLRELGSYCIMNQGCKVLFNATKGNTQLE